MRLHWFDFDRFRPRYVDTQARITSSREETDILRAPLISRIFVKTTYT